MQGTGTDVKRIFFLAELENGEKYVMDLDSQGCQDCIAIGWGKVEGGDHIWTEYYKAKASADPGNSQEHQRKALASSRLILEAKPRTCDRIWGEGQSPLKRLL